MNTHIKGMKSKKHRLTIHNQVICPKDHFFVLETTKKITLHCFDICTSHEIGIINYWYENLNS